MGYIFLENWVIGTQGDLRGLVAHLELDASIASKIPQV